MSEIPEQAFDEGLDYRKMWAALRFELAGCIARDVQGVHPYILMGYMNLLYQLAIFEKKGNTNES